MHIKSKIYNSSAMYVFPKKLKAGIEPRSLVPDVDGMYIAPPEGSF
jgi:hypothetical protein